MSLPAFTHPLMLLALPLALLPLLASLFRATAYPSLAGMPADSVSGVASFALRFCGAVAIAAIVLGLAGPYLTGRTVERFGTGANIVLLIDRSESMNSTFAGRRPAAGEETMASAAARLLSDFVRQRAHDRFGVAAFSTSPIFVMPLTARREAVLAAVTAMDRPGLTRTNVGLGLVRAQAMFSDAMPRGSRAILLVSDGAAVVDPRVQDRLRASFARDGTHLYWLFLRAEGSRSIYDEPRGRDTPQAMPERHLDRFFRSLGVPYRAFEAESPDAIEEAIREIDRLETDPLPYYETTPRTDLSGLLFALAAVAVALLLAAKGLEVDLHGGSRGAV